MIDYKHLQTIQGAIALQQQQIAELAEIVEGLAMIVADLQKQVEKLSRPDFPLFASSEESSGQWITVTGICRNCGISGVPVNEDRLCEGCTLDAQLDEHIV